MLRAARPPAKPPCAADQPSLGGCGPYGGVAYDAGAPSPWRPAESLPPRPTAAPAAEDGGFGLQVGLGGLLALHHLLSISYQIHHNNRHLCF
jgi:hypothetical protein